ncbi:MAG TPA: hypothetical protein DF383_12940 [Deltaproteobacteria bacterium]|nr:hypothetical protein [Deltaproteobacteria bacterium]
MKSLGRSLFAILSSLQLAVIVLLSLAVVLAVGTFYESLYDAETARYYVYGTYWFAALLCLLGLNVLFAAFSRWPWKRHHIGFLVTHLGIITLLVGSLITLVKGYEGQLILTEGESGKRITMQEAQLFLYDVSAGKLDQTTAEFRFDPPTATQPWQSQMLGGIPVKVDAFLPHAAEEIQVKEDNEWENPALQVKLHGSRATLQEWIFSRENGRQLLNLGPATLIYADLPDLQALEQVLKDPNQFRGPVLFIEGEGSSKNFDSGPDREARGPQKTGMYMDIHEDFLGTQRSERAASEVFRAARKWIPVEPNLGKPLRLGRNTLTIDQYFNNAVVEQGELKDRGSEALNPAVALHLQTPTGEERHKVFAKFPELPTLHGKTPSSTRLRLVHLPEDWEKANNALLLVRDRAGAVFYALKAGGAWSQAFRYSGGAEVPTGWMDFNFSVTQDVPRARIEKIYRKVSLPKGQEGPPGAIHMVVGSPAEAKAFWLGRGENLDLFLDGKPYKIAYGLKSHPLGFEIKLTDFRMGVNEGTQDPSSYESQVVLIDKEQQIQKDYLIAMNEPLRHRKYKFFQASYKLNPGGPTISILAVAYDPGIFLKYLGSIIMVSGILLMFFFKPLFVQKRRAARQKQREALSATLNAPGLNAAKGDL